MHTHTHTQTHTHRYGYKHKDTQKHTHTHIHTEIPSITLVWRGLECDCVRSPGRMNINNRKLG